MTDRQAFETRFRAAVDAIDAGDTSRLERLLGDHPELALERLHSPGAWLRDRVGDALDGFFASPYLLWFVAEDPVRSGKLSPNIAEVARAIVRAARRESAAGLQEQLENALRLVSWSTVARECGVQLELVDVLVDAGARPDGCPDEALVNGNLEAAARLLERGAAVTLPSALCLGRWDDAERLAAGADAGEVQLGFVLAALNGNAEALPRAIAFGADVNAPSARLYPHAAPLHHAVWSGSLEAVKVLVEAGADVEARDGLYGGTPLGWAEHALGARGADERTAGEQAGDERAGDERAGDERAGDERAGRYAAIASYLRGSDAPT